MNLCRTSFTKLGYWGGVSFQSVLTNLVDFLPPPPIAEKMTSVSRVFAPKL